MSRANRDAVIVADWGCGMNPTIIEKFLLTLFHSSKADRWRIGEIRGLSDCSAFRFVWLSF